MLVCFDGYFFYVMIQGFQNVRRSLAADSLKAGHTTTPLMLIGTLIFVGTLPGNFVHLSMTEAPFIPS